MIEIKMIMPEDENSIKILSEYKLKLMAYHKRYAMELNIHDEELRTYTKEKALATLSKRDSYLILLNGNPIGYIQVEMQKSAMDNADILFVHGVYIQEEYQNRGFAMRALQFICNKYKLRIECECWYNLPAAKIYEKMGFKKIVTRYFLPTASKYYDSDQN